MKCFYISGALTPDKKDDFLQYFENCRRFFLAEVYLINRGYNVYNPARDLISLLFFPDIPSRGQLLELSIDMIKRCDAVVILPYSENSKGVKEELRVALEEKKPVYKLIFRGYEPFNLRLMDDGEISTHLNEKINL